MKKNPVLFKTLVVGILVLILGFTIQTSIGFSIIKNKLNEDNGINPNNILLIDSVDISLGAVNVVFYFKVEANTDKTYIQYNIEGSTKTMNTYIDPDDINYCDRETWLGESNVERWMIIRGLEPDTTYNYTIKINRGGGYEDYSSGKFKTLTRFNYSTGWDDEFLDDYLWETSNNINLFQSVGRKNGKIDCGNLNDICNPTSATFQDGEYIIHTGNGYFMNSKDPLDFSGTWTKYTHDLIDISGNAVHWFDCLNKWLLVCHRGTGAGLSMATGNNYKHFNEINIRDGDVITDSCILSDESIMDGALTALDTLGANKIIWYDNSHIDAENNRYITDGVMFEDSRVFENWSLGWGENHVVGIRDLYRALTGSSSMETYSMAVRVRNGIYIGFVNLLNDSRPPGGSGGDDTLEVYLVYSRNGLNWSFFDYTTPVIPIGSYGDFDDGMVISRCWITLDNSTNTTHDWVYYRGMDDVHYMGANANLGRIDFRINGFTYAKPVNSNSWIRTTTIPSNFRYNFNVNGKFSESSKLNILVLNAITNDVYPGFDITDSDSINIDSVNIQPTWGNGTRILSDIPGGDFKLLFKWDGMDNGELYSYDISGFIDPNTPSLPDINGPHNGKVRTKYDYFFSSLSPSGQDVYYLVDWGDGNIEDWFGPFNSGEDASASHRWIRSGMYTIKVRAKDTDNLWSPWAEHEITIPRTRTSSYLWYEWLLERFQMLEKLLNLIR